MRLFFGGHCTFCCLSPPTLYHLAWCSRTLQIEVAHFRKCPLHLSVKKKWVLSKKVCKFLCSPSLLLG